MSEAAASERPLCAEASTAAGEALGATASRVEHWLLVEYGGYWPNDPLDATVFAGGLREHLGAQLAALPHSRLLLIKRPGRSRRDRIRIVYGATPERGRRFFTLELERHPDLLELDVAAALTGRRAPAGEPLAHPLLLVCTHGKRDRCCARYGQPLCEGLHAHANGDWVWQSSHVGGDRFAGNLVCLPEGLYFGRVKRDEVRAVLEPYLHGRIQLARYRGRSCYPFAVQAAELSVRRATNLTGFDDLRLLGRRRDGPQAWTVRFVAEVSGAVHEVEVGVEHREETFLTCRAEVPKSARHYVARSHVVS
ncbi:MAG: sucrase ferredoxin [Gaiellaceae bacterium]